MSNRFPIRLPGQVEAESISAHHSAAQAVSQVIDSADVQDYGEAQVQSFGEAQERATRHPLALVIN